MKTRDRREGITLVHTGSGKGKSSSAFGVVFRAAGWDLKVCVIQFIKGKWKTGEQQAAQRFDNIEWHTMGDGFTWDTNNPEKDIATSREIWEFSKQKILSEECRYHCRSVLACAPHVFHADNKRACYGQ